MRTYPRTINAKESFERLVKWLERKIVQDKIPGIIVGVSGTDSIVTFLACYQAYKNLGNPARALAVNFIHNGQKDPSGKIECNDGDKNWFSKELMPWLQRVAPDASFEINDSIPFSDDNKRWGEIFSRAIQEVDANQDLGGKYRYVAGTRNRSEKALRAYSLISKAPSLQPIAPFYKTEILQICEYLNVPQIAIEKSREIDCACGRFDIQAHHMNELDAYIMVQEGELSEKFLETIDPVVLAGVQMFYAEERIRSEFREEIPYEPEPTIVFLMGEDYETALKTQDAGAVGKSISQIMPVIFMDKEEEKARALLSVINDRQEYRAESFVLRGISDRTGGAADITARIGQYTFSFPTKRFTTQGFGNGPSLIERAGFERQNRSNDVRDESLPKWNPQRDEFGTGFTWRDQNIYIEQRRAYILVSDLSFDNPATLLIRNSSHFFGRDRLPEPAYFSLEAKSPEDLLNLTREQIIDPKFFTAWNPDKELSMPMKNLDPLSRMLDILDAVDLKFSQWMKSTVAPRFKTDHPSLRNIFNENGGLEHLRGFLKDAFINHIRQERSGSPLYLANLDKGAAPWSPKNVTAITAELIAELRIIQEGGKPRHEKLQKLFRAGGTWNLQQFVLLTGPAGDFPVAPKL